MAIFSSLLDFCQPTLTRVSFTRDVWQVSGIPGDTLWPTRKAKRDASRLQMNVFVSFFFLLFRITTVEMGTTPSIPSKSPSGCILSNWDKFDTKCLKRKRLVFFCNTVWVRCKLGDGKIWPENGSRNYNTRLQLDLFCQREGKWSEIPYVQAFMALYQDLRFCSSLTLTQPMGTNVD